jgi:protein involved in temperature-dependent protein secretion
MKTDDDFVDSYIDLLNRREYQALEALAAERLAEAQDELSALVIAHSRVGRGLFRKAIEAMYEYERLAPAQARPFVRDICAMCAREEEQIAVESDPSERERLNDMDYWHRRPASAAVRGQAILGDGKRIDFTDVTDIDPRVGRRLFVFGLDRAWKIPFEAISTLELAPKSAMQFDSTWIPAQISLKGSESIQHIKARVPAFYTGSLGHENPQIAAGRVTSMEGPVPLGLRDYELSVDGERRLIGIYQIQAMVFR